MSFLGFTSTRLCLPKDTPTKKPRGSSEARTQDPWITSQTLYHWATWDPLLFLNCFSYKAYIWYKGTSHRCASGGTKVKVICQVKMLRSHIKKKAFLGGISVSQIQLIDLDFCWKPSTCIGTCMRNICCIHVFETWSGRKDLIMRFEGQAYSLCFICPSISQSVFHTSVQSHFSTNPGPNWMKLHLWRP